MLQIVGWLLCVYLIVKGFELVAMRTAASYIGAGIAFVAAPVFFVLLDIQADATTSPFRYLTGSSDRSSSSVATDSDVNAEEAAEAADRALDDAARAVENASDHTAD